MKRIALLVVASGVILAAIAMADGPFWETMLVDNSSPVGMMCNIALDDQDQPHICYWERASMHEARSLKYAVLDGPAWHITRVDTGDVGQYCDIAIDSEGHPHISYNKCLEWATCRGQLKYAHYDGTSWQIEVVDDSGYAGWHTSIALDDHDRPHIAYREHLSNENGNLKYAYYDGANWHIEIVDGGADLGYDTSLALDSRGNPHISYFYYKWSSDESALRYASYGGSRWRVETVDNAHGAGYHTSLALDSVDRPHISYMENNPNSLKYAYFDGALWHITPIEVNPDAGYGCTSLVLDKAERPCISFSYQPHAGRTFRGYLKYTCFNGTSWNTVKIEEAFPNTIVGFKNSLALDSDDEPHIAYCLLEINGGFPEYLKYAYRHILYLRDFTAARHTYDSLALTWSACDPPGERVEGYNLYRRQKGTEDWLKVNGAPIPGGARGSYTDAGLACSRDYEYKLEGFLKGEPRTFGFAEGSTGAPKAFALFPARPNPSSNKVKIGFELPADAEVRLAIYDLSGRRVAAQDYGKLAPGEHEKEYDVSALPPGVYVVSLKASEWSGARKMVVTR